MLRSCRQCGNLEDNEAVERCSVCQGALSESQAPASPPHKTVQAKKGRKTLKPLPVFILLVLLGGVLVAANMHIVRGSTYKGPLLVKRLSAGFSEMFINTDELLNMPVIAAKSRYPLGVAALQRIGFLESDAQRDSRIEQEVQNKIDEINGHSAEDQLYKLKHGHYPNE